jgi:predicted DNA-binding transcriptional regulator AlpA
MADRVAEMPKIRTVGAAVGQPLPTPRLALSIPEFCKAHGISEGLFYKLKRHGEGPREMKVGSRTLISFESAAEWRRTRENQHGRKHRDVRFDDRSARHREGVRRISDGAP